MQVEGYTPGEVREYEPSDFPGLKVWIKTPTEGEKRRISHEGARLRFNESGQVIDPYVIDMGQLVARQDRFVRAYVDRVEGYTGTGGKPITNGEELAEHGESDVVADIAAEIEHSVSLGEERSKKSDALPDS